MSLRTVQMFWHGAPLSRIERLSLASFVHHGHPVVLYVYDPPDAVPAGVTLADAAGILPREQLYRHRRSGSLAPFADWFRYRLLHAHGGLWCDIDMLCVRPLDYASPVVMAWEDDTQINNAVLGLPAGDALAAALADSCERPNAAQPWDTWRARLRKYKRRLLYPGRRERVGWSENGPRGLTRAAHHFGYAGHALPALHFYPVACRDWRLLFASDPAHRLAWPAQTRAVHLWHNMFRTLPGFDKNARFPDDSPFERLARGIRIDG